MDAVSTFRPFSGLLAFVLVGGVAVLTQKWEIALGLGLSSGFTFIRFPQHVNVPQFVLHWGLIQACTVQFIAFCLYVPVSLLFGVYIAQYVFFVCIFIVCYLMRTVEVYKWGEVAYTVSSLVCKAVFLLCYVYE